MSRDRLDDDVYAAPVARVTHASRRHPRRRFWVACLACGIVAPPALVFALDSGTPAWAMTMLLLACFFVPMGWIHYPELRSSTGPRLSLRRLAVASVAFVMATTAVAVLSLWIGGLAFMLFRLAGAA